MIASGQTPLGVSLAATAASLLLLFVVFELIRSRRLRERYALLWVLTGLVLLVLSAWRGGLNVIAGWFGVETYPPAVLFAVALLFVLAVLLALLDRDLEARRPERDPGPAGGPAGAGAQCSLGAGARRFAGRSRGTRSASELSTRAPAGTASRQGLPEDRVGVAAVGCPRGSPPEASRRSPVQGAVRAAARRECPRRGAIR